MRSGWPTCYGRVRSRTTVYKSVGAFATLRQLVKAHAMIVRDTVRVQNRIKAIFRSRGVHVEGKSIYRPDGRDATLQALPDSSRAAACLLLAQYDAHLGSRFRPERNASGEV